LIVWWSVTVAVAAVAILPKRWLLVAAVLAVLQHKRFTLTQTQP
jgi:hypothetical protein